MTEDAKTKLVDDVIGITDGWAKRILILIKYREDYKTVHQYDKADEVRKQLKELGIQINDTKDGVQVTEL